MVWVIKKIFFFIGGNYTNRYEEEKTAHNIFLTFWYKTGAVGIILYLIFIYFIYSRLHFIPAKYLFLSGYIYSLFDVMMSSTLLLLYTLYL